MGKFLFVIGDPIAHTLSPQLQNFCIHHFKKSEIYLPLFLRQSELSRFLRFVRCCKSVLGFNVTLPHKENVLKYLDRIDDCARAIGSVNCIKVLNGKMLGFNTDAGAFGESIFEKTRSGFSGKRVLLFGAGGGSRALVFQLCSKGAAEIVICNRTQLKMETLRKYFSKRFKETKIVTAPFKKSKGHLGTFDLIINATSLTETFDMLKFPLSPEWCSRSTVFFDVNYGPGRLVLQAWIKAFSKRHPFLNEAVAMDGQDMLIRQAARSFSIWYNVSYQQCLRVMSRALKVKGNVQ